MHLMTFRPLHDRVLVRRIDPVATSVAGIRSEDGILKLLDVKSEDRILFEKWSGSEVQVNGENLLIVNGK